MNGIFTAPIRYPETVLHGVMAGLCLSALLINEGAASVALACALCAIVFTVALNLPRLRSNAAEAVALYRSTRFLRMAIFAINMGLMSWLYLHLGPVNEALQSIPWVFAAVSAFALAQDIRMDRLDATPVVEPGASLWMTIWARLEAFLSNPWTYAAAMTALFAAAYAVFVAEAKEAILLSILGVLAIVLPVVLIAFAIFARQQLAPERERLGRLPLAIVGILSLGAGAAAKAIDPETVWFFSFASAVAMLSVGAIATMLGSMLVASSTRSRDTA